MPFGVTDMLLPIVFIIFTVLYLLYDFGKSHVHSIRAWLMAEFLFRGAQEWWVNNGMSPSGCK